MNQVNKKAKPRSLAGDQIIFAQRGLRSAQPFSGRRGLFLAVEGENPTSERYPAPLSRKSMMSLDDPVCLCFHVSKRKVLSFIRVEKPVRASQLSECQGAGTGCGWCRDWLTRMLEDARQGGETEPSRMPDSAEYAAARARYIHETGRQPPPGATPAQNSTGPEAE